MQVRDMDAPPKQVLCKIAVSTEEDVANDIVKVLTRVAAVSQIPKSVTKTKLLHNDIPACEELYEVFNQCRTDHIIMGNFRRHNPALMSLINNLGLVIK